MISFFTWLILARCRFIIYCKAFEGCNYYINFNDTNDFICFPRFPFSRKHSVNIFMLHKNWLNFAIHYWFGKIIIKYRQKLLKLWKYKYKYIMKVYIRKYKYILKINCKLFFIPLWLIKWLSFLIIHCISLQ